MLHINRFVLSSVLGLLISCFCIPCHGESIIYLFLPSVAHMINGRIDINGTDSFEFQGELKKESRAPSFAYPIRIYKACKKKVIMQTEGKVLISYSADKFDIRNGNVIKDYWKAEIQVNCMDGSEHYVKVAPKGFSNCQLKFMDAKEYKKRLDDDKYVLLDDYFEK